MKSRYICPLLSLTMFMGMMWMGGACLPSSVQTMDVSGEYINYPQATRLILDKKDRSLLMTKGMEVLSQGNYFVKWQRLYCRRDDGCIVIGKISDDRIMTDLGDFIRQ
ncbi:MAG: hypothetical protein V2A34_02960 [Lentisphaerota bacterium]